MIPAKRLQLSHLVSSLNIGGLKKVVYDLVRFVDRERFEVKGVCPAEGGAGRGFCRRWRLDLCLERVGAGGNQNFSCPGGLVAGEANRRATYAQSRTAPDGRRGPLPDAILRLAAMGLRR
jgi:hypothetical protein